MSADEEAFYDAVLPAADADLSEAAVDSAQFALLDAAAVVLATLDHEVAAVSRQAFRDGSREAVAWGVPGRCSVRAAVTANGAALRCYDFNDLYIAASGQGGHPSDAIPGLVAVAESCERSGTDLVAAIIMAYDDIVRLMDLANITQGGWDYANLVGLGSVRAFAHLMRLDEEARKNATGIVGTSRLATNELESGALGKSGNLTSWKRFNGSQAVLAAIDACRLAAAGVEAPFGSLTGRNGFFAQQSLDATAIVAEARRTTARVGVLSSMYKRWPVGSRAQSAIRAALGVRARIPAGLSISKVTIRTHREVIAHLLRPDSFRPLSRETADHSLPYVTCVALCEGDVRFGDFDEPTAWRRSYVAGLLEHTEVEALDDERPGSACGYPTQVAVTLSDGSVLAEDAAVPPDALTAGAMAEAIDEKWSVFAGARLGPQAAPLLRDLITDLRSVRQISTLTAALSG